MSYSDNKKFSAEDFSSYEAIDNLYAALDGDINKNDEDGYTPLCAAILNNADPLMLLYLTKLTVSVCPEGINPSNCLPKELRTTKNANPTLKCDKGKTPLQVAIMSGNVNAINFLLGNLEVDVMAQEEVTRNAYSFYRDVAKYENGLPVYKKDDQGNQTDEYDYYYIKIKSDLSEFDLEVTPKDIINAASSPKADILTALSESYNDDYSVVDDNNFKFDNRSNTPLIMAAKYQCYDSLRLICEKISSQYSDSLDIVNAICHTSLDGESAFSIARDNEDNGAINIMSPYLSELSLLNFAFSNNQLSLIESLLDGKMTSESFDITNWTYGEDDATDLLTNHFAVADGYKSVLQYINDYYSDDLPDSSSIKYFFNSIVNKISSLSDSDKRYWLRILINDSCYKFICKLIDNHIITYYRSNDNLYRLYDYAITEFNDSRESIDDISLLNLYIESKCYFLVETLIINSINGSNLLCLNQAELEFVSDTDNDSIIQILKELAYE